MTASASMIIALEMADADRKLTMQHYLNMLDGGV